MLDPYAGLDFSCPVCGYSQDTVGNGRFYQMLYVLSQCNYTFIETYTTTRGLDGVRVYMGALVDGPGNFESWTNGNPVWRVMVDTCEVALRWIVETTEPVLKQLSGQSLYYRYLGAHGRPQPF
ncbi:hypothetical protein TNCV_1759791 [Trichonephila clavipes]|nr:hypothetical protein TNCV_1759791 [Trichonephila clavipes]